jgi:hypothetical protein
MKSAGEAIWRGRIGSFATVTAVALLLWLWAAGRTTEVGTISVQARFASGDPGRVAVLPPTPFTVELRLRGSRRDLDDAASRLAGTVLELRSGGPGIPAAIGDHVIDLATSIDRSEELSRLGASVDAANPASATVEVVELVSVEAPITPDLPGVRLAGGVTVEPERVTVRLPAALFRRLDGPPRLEAYLPPSQSEALATGRRHSIEVPLRLPESLEADAALVTLEPARARLSFTIADRSRTATLPLVPVQVAGPPEDLDAFTVTLADGSEFLRDVVVQGRADLVRDLEEGRARAIAFIHLSADDLAKRVSRKRISLWMLPEGVEVTAVAGSDETSPAVEVSIRDRVRR